MILLIVGATYPLSAALLGYLKWKGQTVLWAWPVAWLVCGAVGLAAAWLLRSGGMSGWWWLALVALAPLMAVSTVVDTQHALGGKGGMWFMVGLDVAGLLAIIYGLWLVTRSN